MGFVGDLLGFGDNSGMSFRADRANILQPTTLDQTNQAYDQSQAGLQQQQDFLNALKAQNGISNQSQVFNQQQALANQLQGVANGTGPNPALQQLQNTTGQNVANQASLMAGQRGAGANVGLLGRQIAQQGANIQQQAVGQGAALSAQQQLAGMNALQGQQNMLGNLAGTQVGQQANATLGYNQAAQGQQGQLLNSLGQFNNQNVAMQSNMNETNSGVAQQTAKGQQGLLGGLMNGAGVVGSALIKGVGKATGGGGGGMAGGLGDGAASGVGFAAHGGMIPQHFQQGGSVMSGPQSLVGQYLKSPSNMKAGGPVPGHASVEGDSLKNDTVPAMLSPGEVVIPRHVMQSRDPAGNSAKFVAAVLAKKGMR